MIDVEAAVELDRRLRASVRSIADSIDLFTELVEQAQSGEIHEPLGFRSWPEYVTEVVSSGLGDQLGKLHRDHRRQLVEVLLQSGMSKRSIAPAVGVGTTQIQRDTAAIQSQQQVAQDGPPAPTLPTVITGRNGRQYPAKRKPKPKPPPPPRSPSDEERATVIAERVSERARGLAKACRDLITLPDLTPEMASLIAVLTFPAVDDMNDAFLQLYERLDALEVDTPILKAVP
jgi:hypothetical protein